MCEQIILKKLKQPNGTFVRKTSRDPNHFKKDLYVTVTDPCNYNKMYSLKWTEVPAKLKQTWTSEEFITGYWGPDAHLLKLETATDNIDAAISSGMVPAECIGKNMTPAKPFGDIMDARANYLALLRTPVPAEQHRPRLPPQDHHPIPALRPYCARSQALSTSCSPSASGTVPTSTSSTYNPTSSRASRRTTM